MTSFFLAGDDSTTTSPDRETLKQQRGIMVYTFLKMYLVIFNVSIKREFFLAFNILV